MPYFYYFFRQHRAALITASVAALFLFCVITICFNDIRMTRAATAPKQSTTAAMPAPLKQSERLIQSLPDSSTDIAELIHRVADAAQMSIEEISYESREEHDLPIVRRNASFTLTDSYANIRHYLDNVVHAQSNLTLDALDCTRDDISSRDVNCAVTISAYQHLSPSESENNHVR